MNIAVHMSTAKIDVNLGYVQRGLKRRPFEIILIVMYFHGKYNKTDTKAELILL